MGISSSGIGSGLDVNSIVSQMMAAERVPLTRLKIQEGSYDAKISAYAKLASDIAGFQEALGKLSGGGFTATAATSSNTEILGVSTTNAKPGNYAIQVISLAKEHKLAASSTSGLASTTNTLESGAMTIEVGDQKLVIDGVYSLESLVNRINSSNKGVTATIINTGSSPEDSVDPLIGPNRLVISADDPGKTITITNVTGGLDRFAASKMQSMQDPQNATIIINGIEVKKPSNTIEDAIAGVTLNLVKADPTNTLNVTVGRDKGMAKSAINTFVSTFNKLSSTITEQTKYDLSTKKGAPLNNERSVNSMLSALQMELNKAVEGITNSGLPSLTELGVTLQKGTLNVNDVKLEAALSTKFNNIEKLFSSADGFATRMTKITKDMLSPEGQIGNRIEGLKSSKSSIIKNQDAFQLRLESTEKRLRAQFVALDAMLSGMQTTSSYLSQQLAALAKNN